MRERERERERYVNIYIIFLLTITNIFCFLKCHKNIHKYNENKIYFKW